MRLRVKNAAGQFLWLVERGDSYTLDLVQYASDMPMRVAQRWANHLHARNRWIEPEERLEIQLFRSK